MKRSRMWRAATAAASAAVLAGALGSAAWAADTVKVGYLIPLSGTAAAAIGQEMSRATHLAVDHINEEGGIKALGGAKLQLVEVDTRGDPQVAITEAERLINVEKVSVLIGAFQSSVTFPASAIAEKYQVPWIVDLSAKAEITERGFKYVFRPTQIPSSGNADSAADFIAWAGKTTGKQPKTGAIVYENTDWGQDLANTMRKRMAEMGIKVVFDESYPPNSPNLRPLVVKLKGAHPDVISMTSYTGDAVQLQKLIAQLRVDAMAIVGSAAGHVDRTFVPTVGVKAADMVFTTNGWAGYDSAITTPFARRFWDQYVGKYQADPTEFGVTAYADVWILKDALERAGSADPKAIRDALAKTDMKDNDITRLVGYDIAFDSKNQNTLKRFVVQQIKDGKYYTVWPSKLTPAGYKMVWPVPDWSDR
ncbi:amino acid/amide ABC transporter substrate-binding protein, HAAT family [Tistlia consotensis]|uniref:Amino acid/amide ABC transporter substrate-binding protein, HAAT family n=1 Tax=Tistlia consotensis USBA 355 TaxID=560819 RepID=A0A1Y6B951_9PROT|nr:ABC transporter substrate-binding protein [Tistlia consotensis]SME91128.1 amino acid/amide ABC transporter substrate-binding protein, HAAT family [Tistlia consotensis USBA 355]SNR27142.1 amino acid/amide ABC transporter substrate-binding protein, HAAT family [Tistlia consotensis]